MGEPLPGLPGGHAEPDTIELTDGTQYEVDIIVLATGFRANDFLWPMNVLGRGGQSIDELWARDGARAYLGAMLPGFPNFYMLYGPNTNGGEIVSFLEHQSSYAVRAMKRMRREICSASRSHEAR